MVDFIVTMTTSNIRASEAVQPARLRPGIANTVYRVLSLVDADISDRQVHCTARVADNVRTFRELRSPVSKERAAFNPSALPDWPSGHAQPKNVLVKKKTGIMNKKLTRHE